MRLLMPAYLLTHATLRSFKAKNPGSGSGCERGDIISLRVLMDIILALIGSIALTCCGLMQ